jgi:glycosyltransferase involved in cell wall biosynthesis
MAAPGAAQRRILLVETNEDQTVGGSHQALFDLVRHLDRSCYEPVVLFYQDNSFVQRFRDLGVQVVLFSDERRKEWAARMSPHKVVKAVDFIASILRRARIIRTHRIDLVHINNSPRTGCDDWLPACGLLDVPIVASVRGDADGESSLWRRFLFRRFDRIMPVSDWLGSSMQRAGFPRDRITVVRDGVDSAELKRRVRRSREEVRSEIGAPRNATMIVMAGNIRRWKGQHVLLEALALLSPEEQSALHVCFVGATNEENLEYEQGLRDLAVTTSISATITWLGSRADLPELFVGADLAVHCSIIAEPFGLVVAEAMALGCPVAASNSGGPAEIVTPESGWLHDPDDCTQLAGILRTVLADPGLIRDRAEGARQRAAGYSVHLTATAMTNVYNEMLRRDCQAQALPPNHSRLRVVT